MTEGYTSLYVKTEMRDKLREIAKKEKRSIVTIVELMIEMYEKKDK